MFLPHRLKDLTITNLTLHNTTPRGGSQAEALILNGQADAHAVVAGVDLYSFQDTLQINGQAYVSDCYIEGDVDFMWGTGPVFLEKVHAKTVRSGAYYTQIRNGEGKHGYVYKECLFDGAEGVTNNMLSRIEPTRFPGSEVVLINCAMTDAVAPVGWKLDRATEAPKVHFWEYNSHTPDGKPVDVSQRLSWSKQLKEPADAETIKNYSNPAWVLGWDPAERVKALK
jgi:pectin methylesterase-like acyl-CoA thioesterase